MNIIFIWYIIPCLVILTQYKVILKMSEIVINERNSPFSVTKEIMTTIMIFTPILNILLILQIIRKSLKVLIKKL